MDPEHWYQENKLVETPQKLFYHTSIPVRGEKMRLQIMTIIVYCAGWVQNATKFEA
jgi:hypothetical protein